MRLGLALSGGGLRATYFHLGIIRYLSEHGLLCDVKHVTSVSGGSILAAHLVLNWSLYLKSSSFDEAAKKLLDLAQKDLRGRILRRLPTHFPLTYFDRGRPRRSKATRNLLFEAYLAKYLFDEVTLEKAREKNVDAPNLNILATNLTRGTLAYFTDNSFVPDERKEEIITTAISLAKAVSISAAFPGFFPPIEVDNDTLGVDDKEFPTTEYLTDGGVYDNLGLRRFRTLLATPEPPVDHVLVCDASGHFDWVDSREEQLGLLRTALRSTEIFMKRLAELESEVFSVDKEHRFTHIQISDLIEPSAGRDRPVLSTTEQRLLKNVRTDLDYFSPLEVEALMSHGYSSAEENCRFLGGTFQLAPKPPAGSQENIKARVKSLEKSRLRRFQLFSFNDRISYLHLIVLMAALAILAFHFGSGSFRDRLITSLHEDYKRDIFNKYELGSQFEANRLLSEVEVAQKRWPDHSTIQTEVALAAYSIVTSNFKEKSGRGLALLDIALATLEKLPDVPLEERIISLRLRGHYLMTEGEKLRKDHLEDARGKFSSALQSYEEAKRLSSPFLYKDEFNVCSAARRVGDLDHALEQCRASDEHARERKLNFWPAKAIMGSMYLQQEKFGDAASSFLVAWELSKRTSAQEVAQVVNFIKEEVDRHPALCFEDLFRKQFADVCTAAVISPPKDIPAGSSQAPH